MFGGIIQHLGIVRDVTEVAGGLRLAIESAACLGASVGDSIAIDGVCLTVTSLNGSLASFDVWPESLHRTSLGGKRPGDAVHCEAALLHGAPIGGHPIEGHVDFAAALIERDAVPGSDQLRLWISLPAAFDALLPERAYAAVNGVSLTVTGRRGHSFSVSLIPETLRLTRLGELQPGETLNIEIDPAMRATHANPLLDLRFPPPVGAEPLDPLEAARAALHQGRPVLLVDDSLAGPALSLVLLPQGLALSTLTAALALSRSPAICALSPEIAERLAIPAPSINSLAGSEEGRRILIPVRVKGSDPLDFSPRMLQVSLDMMVSPDSGIGSWACPGNLQAIQIFSDESDETPACWEAAVGLAENAGFPGVALCLPLHDAAGTALTAAAAPEIAARFRLPMLAVAPAAKLRFSSFN